MAHDESRREAREDVLLGHVLLKQKFVTPEQLKQAVAEQAAGLARGRKKPRRLGVILVSQKRITDQQFIGFLREIEEQVQEEESELEKDRRLGETLASRGVVSREQVDECLRMQQEALDQGVEVIRRLGELLIEEGYAKTEAVVLALKPEEEPARPAPRAAVPRPTLKPAVRPPRPAVAPLRSRAPAAVPAPAAQPLLRKAVHPALPGKVAPRGPAAPPPVKAAPARPVSPPAPPSPPSPPPRPAAPKPAKVRDSSKPDIPLIDPPAEEPSRGEENVS